MPRTLQTDPFLLYPLKSKFVWQLFQHHASEKASLFEEILDKIIEKCKGSPLAVKEIARMLRSEPNMERWDNVLRRDLLESDDRRKEILLDLELGYRGLRAAVKRCFMYCSLFPKKYQFNRDYLIMLWMAEGFLQMSEAKPESMLEVLNPEKMGEEYFKELVSRSFLLYTDVDDEFVMPNLVHDLAQSISGDYCSRTENEAPESEDELARAEESISWEPSPGVRHSSLVVRNYKAEIQCHPPPESSTLHSFLVISIEGVIARTNFPSDMFVNMGYVRTLDLSYTNLKELPESISKMKHLHFLGLEGTEIRILPESIVTLYNLQYLQLRYCKNLEELPRGIGNLSSLRHLGLDTSLKFPCMPSGMGRLTELQTLPLFKVGRNVGSGGLSELGKLNNLTGKLYISGLCNVENIKDCRHACLSDKISLTELILVWPSHRDDLEYLQLSDDEGGGEDSNDEEWVLPDEGTRKEEDNVTEEGKFTLNGNQDIFEVESPSYDIVEQSFFTSNFVFIRKEKNICVENPQDAHQLLVDGKKVHADDVLEQLRPPINLELLTIQSYEGFKFSGWLSDSSFKKLKFLTLKNCKMCQQLPSLGLLPSLEDLAIEKMSVKCVGLEFCGRSEIKQELSPSSSRQPAFPQLKKLSLKEMYELVDWLVVEGEFPKLKKLSLFNCPKLRELPYFSSLKKLEIENCAKLAVLPIITSLTKLKVVACSLTTIHVSQSLKNLAVIYCDTLESLLPLQPDKISLRDLTLMYCDRLESFPTLEPKAKQRIRHCKYLPSVG